MKQKKRKNGLCMVTLVMCVAFTALGCGKKAGTASETDTAKPTETVVETTKAAAAETQAAMEAAVKTETGTNVSNDLLHVLCGTVIDAGMSSVTVKNDKYPEGVTLSKEDAANGFENGLAIDQEITIFYSGEIKDTDASGVTVELLRDKRDGDEEAQAAMVSGKVVSIGMSVVTIETADGRNLSFEQDPKPVNTTEGPVEGDRVTIVYSYQDEGQEGAVVPELIREEK